MCIVSVHQQNNRTETLLRIVLTIYNPQKKFGSILFFVCFFFFVFFFVFFFFSLFIWQHNIIFHLIPWKSVWICRFPLPLGVWEGLRFVIVALPGLFSYLFFDGVP